MKHQTHYIVQSAKAPMPSSCFDAYNYYRLAVLEVDSDLSQVSMISTHARGCHRVVQTCLRKA